MQTKRKMLVVEPLDFLLKSEVFAFVPKSVKTFVVFFFSRLGNYLGAEFALSAKEKVSEEVDLILSKLEYLRSNKVVSGYGVGKRDYIDEPHIYSASVSLALPNQQRRTGFSGRGRSLFGFDEAWGPAYGEALERWCVEYFDPPPEHKKILSVSELKDLGLDLFFFPGMSGEDRKNSRYFFSNESKFQCTLVEELTTNTKQYAPLQWFSFKHGQNYVHTGKEPLFHPLITTGAATGTSRAEAVLGGIYECLERDAFSLYWLRKITPQKVDLNSLKGKDSQKIKELCDRYQLEPHFLYLKTNFPVHTILCVLIDRSGVGPAITMDASTGGDIETAVKKTFMGAAGMRGYLRRTWQEKMKDQELVIENLSIDTRTFWWYKTEQLEKLNFLLAGSFFDLASIEENNFHNLDEELDFILKSFKTLNYKVYCADVLPDKLKKNLGEDAVVFVKIPDLIPMHLSERERSTVGDRLLNLPAQIGLEVGTDGVNNLPHPFF